jgi:hypothetical protein
MTITFAAAEGMPPKRGRALKPFSDDLLSLVKGALKSKSHTIETEAVTDERYNQLHTEYVRWRRHEGKAYDTLFQKGNEVDGKHPIFLTVRPK